MSRKLSKEDADQVYVQDILYTALSEECEGDTRAMLDAWTKIKEAGDRFFSRLAGHPA